MKYNKSLVSIVFLLLGISANASNKDSLEVLKAANAFVSSFNNFDWPAFKAAFLSDATVFFPTPDKSKRVAGQSDIEAAWINLFPEFVDSNNTRRLQIAPKDIHIQLYEKTAIVTFHLGSGANSVSRRTLVMIKGNKGWKIAHLHASMISNEKSN